MLGAECRIRAIGLTGLIVLVGLAPLVPDASGRPAIGAAARGHAKRCGGGRSRSWSANILHACPRGA